MNECSWVRVRNVRHNLNQEQHPCQCKKITSDSTGVETSGKQDVACIGKVVERERERAGTVGS